MDATFRHRGQWRSRGARRLAVTALVTLITASCGDEVVPSASSSVESTSTVTPSTTLASSTTVATEGDPTTSTSSTTVPLPDNAVMQLSFQFAANARWSDGEKMSVADVACTVEALRSTPGSTESSAYDAVVDVRAGRAEDVVEVSFDRIEAGYRVLFDRLLQASAVDDCGDVSSLWADSPPPSMWPFTVEVWNSAQMILGVVEDTELGFERLVLVPIGDIDLEVDVLRSGEVDLIVPELSAGVAERLDDPNLRFELQASGRHEDLYLNDTNGGIFSDEVFRDAFWRSVDRDRLVAEVYDEIRAGSQVWDCGPITAAQWCDGVTPFAGSFDPGGAGLALTEAGWTFDGDGHWQDASGEPHQIRWLVDAGHGRQLELASSLVPMLAEQGFDVVVEECSGDCVFRDRVAAGEWDMVIYAEEGLADIGLFARRYACDERSTGSAPGWNLSGFCDAEADALLSRALSTRDDNEQAGYVEQVLERLAATRHVLPLVRLPSAIAWRPDKLGPESVLTSIRTAAMWEFDDLLQLEDLDGDGQIVIGVEQWPSCENPVLACGGVGWYRRSVGAVMVPGLWGTDDGNSLTHTPLVRQEPFVTVLKR